MEIYLRDGYEIADHVKMHSDPCDIPLTNLALDTIKKVMDANKQYGYEKEGYLFVDKNGIKTPKMVEKQLSNGCKNLKIRYRSPHKMRKTYASTLINNYVPLTIVQSELGHKEPTTTLRSYVFNNTDKETERENVRNALNKRFEE